LLALDVKTAFAQAADGSGQLQLNSEGPTPTLTDAGEIDITAMAKEFNLPSQILNPFDGRIEMYRNAVERTIRPIALQRKTHSSRAMMKALKTGPCSRIASRPAS
jgi:hypothetical protein